MKVLIIDDEPAVLKMYREELEREHFEVLTALSGEKGLEMAFEDKPGVILLDIIMPKLNGLDVLKMLKENAATQNIPVFLLTNLPEESSGEKAKELGATGYLVKAQYEPGELVKVLKKQNTKIAN